MGWADSYITKLLNNESVSFRPQGNSMSGKIESGQFELIFEPVEARKLIWKLIQANKVTAVRKKVSIDMEIDRKVP